MVSQWVIDELETVDLGDKRRNERLAEVLSAMAGLPSKSIPAAVGAGHNETTAAYRLFDNDAICFEDILAPHIDACYKRLAEQEVVILAHDTTELDLTKPNTQVEGAGPLDGSSRYGELLHPLMAFTPTGTPLGTVAAELWTREEGPSKADDRKKVPIEEKESLRWLENHREAQLIASEHPETQVVCVADSEADIFEVIECNSDSPKNFWWIIRSCYDSSIVDQHGRPSGNLHEKLAASKVRYTKAITILSHQPKLACDKRARNQPREARQCELEVRATTLTLKNPYRPDRHLRPTKVNAIWAHEIDPPEGDTPISWLLLTNMPISNKEEIELVLSYYCIRWLIEVFFRTLKSGTRIEAKRFEKIERFERCLAVSMILAWRTFYSVRIGRECPDVSCEAVFVADEWQPVYKIVTGEDPPKKPPTLKEIVRMIARLGGYIDRPRHDEPGTDTVMRGMERLYDISSCWRSFGPNATRSGE
ncbi:Transposase for transposon Tn5 [Stieleria maiorica]|uniref:Transposase for transposon Tn5 n=1 Tax=Stieleria maiorica TaxID=2795974 RepID=A0A5B9MRB7_9BACT|nr:IS4 family transposase [Stieleria maiorica]QEG02811.1 Transposase for transposon Tn5 [Stieleria maiorica]